MFIKAIYRILKIGYRLIGIVTHKFTRRNEK